MPTTPTSADDRPTLAALGLLAFALANVQRSLPWLVSALLISIFFVGVPGPGIHFHQT